MAVEIPRLNRLDIQPQESAGRIQTDLPDFNKPQAQISNAVEGLGSEIAGYVAKIEDQDIHNKSTELLNQYEEWYRERLDGKINPDGSVTQGLRHLSGDPSGSYQTFDEEAVKKREELLSNGGLSDRGKRYLLPKMASLSNQLHDKRSTVFGYQYSKWQDDTKQKAIGLANLGLQDAGATFNPNDKRSVLAFDAGIERIKELNVRHGLQVGNATEAENGAYSIKNNDGTEIRFNADPELQFNVKKDIADAIYQSIDNQINAQQPDRAQAILDKYGDYVDEKRKAELYKAMNKTHGDMEAYTILAKMDNMDLNGKLKALKQYGKEHPEKIHVKEKALELLSSQQARLDGLKNRQGEEFYDKAWNIVSKKQNSDDPYDSIDQMENALKAYIPYLKPKHRKALQEMVGGGPEHSDPETLERLQKKIQDQTFKLLSPQQLTEAMQGLKESDKTRYRTRWETQTSESTPQERSKLGYALKTFEQAYEDSGLLRKIRGKVSPASNQEMVKAKEEFMSLYEGITGHVSAAENDRELKKFIARKKIQQYNENRKKGFNLFGIEFSKGEEEKALPEMPSFRKSKKSNLVEEETDDEEDTPKPKEPVKANKAAPVKKETKVKRTFGQLNDRERMKLREDFKKAKGRKHKDLNELNAFLAE